MPRRNGGENNTKVSGWGGENAAEIKPEQGEKEELHQGPKKRLRKAVKQAVNKHGDEIADSLVDRTMDGDMRCAAVMMSLMEKKKASENDKPWDGPSVAEMLASEPEWDEEMENEKRQETKDLGDESRAA